MKTNNLWILSGLLGMTCLAQTAVANPVTVCRLGQCVPAKNLLSAEQMYDYTNALFDANIGQNMTFCQADPITKSCYQPDMVVSVASPVIQSDVRLSKAVLLDAKEGKNPNTLSALLDMEVEANGTYPLCESVHGVVAVHSADKISITGYPFKCAFTDASDTVLSLNFDVDFVDFDVGKIGAFYTLGARQAMVGDTTGYVVLTMAHPVATTFELTNKPTLSAELVSVEQAETEKPACEPCEKDEIQIHSEMAYRALAEAKQAEITAKMAMEKALEKAQQAARATEEVAEQKAVAAQMAQQEADAAAQMAEQARMRVNARVAALNGPADCGTDRGDDCPKCAECPQYKGCKKNKEVNKSCGCMTKNCPHAEQTQMVEEEVAMPQVSQEVTTPQKMVTKTVVRPTATPKTTVTQTITRKRVVKSNGQIVEETEDTEVIPADKILSQEEINVVGLKQKQIKAVEIKPEVGAKKNIETTHIVIPTYKKEKTLLEKIAGFFWLDGPEN